MDRDPFVEFLDSLRRATNETARRELFVVLAATAFRDTGFATGLALGAEYRVNFEQSGLIRRGAVDAFYGNLVIEFETSMARTGLHALDQLRGYVAGAWREDTSTNRAYLAVASDGARWEVYSPRLTDPAGPIAAENITLDLVEAWEPSGLTGDGVSLQAFLNRLFFRHELMAPTADNFARDFGVGSPAFLRARDHLLAKMAELEADPGLEVCRRLWRESLEVVYGSIAPDDELFAKHTYLAVLARLLVWAALEHRHLEERELAGVLDGTYFVGKRIANLVEDDFFRWHELPSPTDARRAWIGLARHLGGYDLGTVAEDVLKPLYEQLVDPATRQLLGEFYTPDWLAVEVTEHLLESWDFCSGPPAVIDPACGSGTFLRTTIDHIRTASEAAGVELRAEDVLGSVMGVDVHPLAVTIARATYLLALRGLVETVGRPITIPVFLANSLHEAGDEGRPTLFGAGTTQLRVGEQGFDVPTEFVWDGPTFDAAIDDVMAVARAYGNSAGDDLDDVAPSLEARLGGRLALFPAPGDLLATLTALSRRVAELIRARADSVYGFVLKNNYRPFMVRRSFDFVIGNPPWLTVGDIETAAYRHLVVTLGSQFNIAARATGDQRHTELATIFLAHAVSEQLGGENWAAPRVALVMPRSIFAAGHHRLLRQGLYVPRFSVAELWDLDGVRPLFRVPSAVLFAAVGEPRPTDPIPGRVYSGVLPAKDVAPDVATLYVDYETCQFVLSFLAQRSAWVRVNGDHTAAGPAITRNAYVGAFRQGAILYPQTLLTVLGASPLSRGAGPAVVRTDPAARSSAKLLREVDMDRVVDSTSLFTTAAAEHLGPFVLLPPLWTVVLPTIGRPGEEGFAPVGPTALRRAGLVATAAWLDWAESQWAQVRKEGEETPLHERLDYLGHLAAQADQRRHVVLYTASGARPVAAIVDRDAIDPPFVARDKTYWASFDSADEAKFVAAYLNSDYLANAIEAWMTRGLFGPRDVHKRALDVPWPEFDATDAQHRELVEVGDRLSTQAAAAAAAFGGGRVAAARDAIRTALSAEDRSRLEELVLTISQSVGEVTAMPAPDDTDSATSRLEEWRVSALGEPTAGRMKAAETPEEYQ